MKASENPTEAELASRDVAIGMPEGLHARPSTLLSQAAARYSGSVRIHANGQIADAKSIFDLLALGLPQGSVVTIEVEGPNATDTLNSIAAMFDTDFSEPS